MLRTNPRSAPAAHANAPFRATTLCRSRARLLGLLLLPFSFTARPTAAVAQAPMPELTPPGWSMRVSTNSLYLTRPDLPNIQIARVNDIRADLTPDEKFEAAKAFFAERAGCPGLADAETENSFAGYVAFDDAQAPRCYLVASGHWREGGLQISLVLNETPSAGPRPGDDVFDAILGDIVLYSMLRYEAGDQDIEADIAPEVFSDLVGRGSQPEHIVGFTHSSAVYLDVLRAIGPASPEPGEPLPRTDERILPMVLFAAGPTEPRQLASLCVDWDPGLFSPATILTYHAENRCFRVEWRWADGVEGGDLEVKPIRGDWMRATDYLTEVREAGFARGDSYRKLRRGATFDLQLGLYSEVLRSVAAGESPISALGPNDAILTSDGRITLGHLESATLPDLDPEVATYRPVSGRYFFDGHVVTIKLDGGHVVRGFAGWIPGAGETELGAESTLMINGVHYMGR